MQKKQKQRRSPTKMTPWPHSSPTYRLTTYIYTTPSFVLDSQAQRPRRLIMRTDNRHFFLADRYNSIPNDAPPAARMLSRQGSWRHQVTCIEDLEGPCFCLHKSEVLDKSEKLFASCQRLSLFQRKTEELFEEKIHARTKSMPLYTISRMVLKRR